MSGPYRLTRHPLYLGSTIIGIGLAIASASVVVALLVVVYLGVTLSAAIATEEAHLTAKFGGAIRNIAKAACRASRGASARRGRCGIANTARWPACSPSLRCCRGKPYNSFFAGSWRAPTGVPDWGRLAQW